MAEETELEQGSEQAKGGKGKIIIMAVGAVLLLGGGIFAGPKIQGMIAGDDAAEVEGDAVAEGDAEAEAPKKEALYQGIHPPLLINFQDDRGRSRFLQMSLEVMAREQSVIDALSVHDAVIRNNLILLYGDVKIEDLNGRDGKAAMLVQARDEINTILTEQTGDGGVEAVYFTNLVVQ